MRRSTLKNSKYNIITPALTKGTYRNSLVNAKQFAKINIAPMLSAI
jgi:hypothetical protein